MAESSEKNDPDWNLVDLPEEDDDNRREQESGDYPSEEHILPDSPELKQLEEITESIGKPAKVRRRRKTISCITADDSYVSSIYEVVKLRNRRKSVHMRELAEDDGNWVSNAQKHKKKLRQRRKSIAISRSTSPEPILRSAKITKRRKTMYPGEVQDNYQEEESEDIGFRYSRPQDYNDFSNGNEFPADQMMKPSNTGGTSRRKSLLKPMDTEVKFEKIISYRNPTIPHKNQYKMGINALNRITNPNEQTMRRLACLKVFRQYFRAELSVLAKQNKSMKKAMDM